MFQQHTRQQHHRCPLFRDPSVLESYSADIFASLRTWWVSCVARPSSAYTMSVRSSGITIAAGTVAGILAGTTTLLQACSSAPSSSSPPSPSSPSSAAAAAAVTIPAMDVVDVPFRDWRGVQLDLHGTPYHDLDLLKTHIDMARWYKLNTLTFNLGPSIWYVVSLLCHLPPSSLLLFGPLSLLAS